MNIGLTIPRRNICCSRGEESLLRESLYYSVLEQPTPRQMVRHDFCPTCWKHLSSTDAYPHKIAQWRVEKRSEKRENSSSFFRERGVIHLLELLEEGFHERAFLFALILQREKILVLRNEREEEWIFEEEETGQFIHITPIDPSSQHIEECRRWLQDVYRVA